MCNIFLGQVQKLEAELAQEVSKKQKSEVRPTHAQTVYAKTMIATYGEDYKVRDLFS